MKIFLSYSQPDYAVADEIRTRLAKDGNKVFFAHEPLLKGDDFDTHIRRTIAASDFFIFLISPTSVAERSSCQTELRYARRRWPNPEGRVLPVLVSPTPFAQVPSYLRSTPIFATKGNLVAELAVEVQRHRERFRAERAKVKDEQLKAEKSSFPKRVVIILIVVYVLRWAIARLIDIAS